MSIKSGLNANAEKWIASLGFPHKTLDTPMDAHVDGWWSYLTRTAAFYERREVDAEGQEHKVRVRSCTPAEMVDEDMAALIYNERASVSCPDVDDGGVAQAWLDTWLDRVRWHDLAPLAVKRMCDTGTAAWALQLRNVAEAGTSPALSVVPVRYDARSIVPLEWDASGCTACAFKSTVRADGEDMTQVEVHRLGPAGTYLVSCALFDESGEIVRRDGLPDPDAAVDTRQPLPTFQLIRLARDNRWWEGSPMGVALFSGLEDVLETVDLAFDNLGNEIFLGRKMLAVDESMMKRDQNGRLHLPWMDGQQFFLATKSNTYDNGLGVFEYNPTLRADEDRKMLATALQMLGKRAGFGTKYYSLDSTGSITTAKQVASDNAELMRTVRRHEHLVRPAVEGIVEAAGNICRTLGGAQLPDMAGAVHVELGDSIMEDDDTARERDRADVAAGLLEPWRYMVRWQGYTEADAKAAQGASDELGGIPVEA